MNTAIYIQSEGRERILVPVRPETPNVEPEPEPDPVTDHNFQPPADIEMNGDEYVPPPKRNRAFYMREFVARADGILQAIQAREAMPDYTKCAECDQSIAHWRCEDCTERKLLCRVCMRRSHFSNPFHRIECWSGTHFRKAALWEVGVYLMLPHQHGGICANLLWQKQLLEKFQTKKDQVTANHLADLSEINYTGVAEPEPDPQVEAAQDETEMRFLDQPIALTT